jgi:hypothetical protein
MSDAELDDLYTALCEALADNGEARAIRLLGRFALLAMVELDDPTLIRSLIERAARADDGPRS